MEPSYVQDGPEQSLPVRQSQHSDIAKSVLSNRLPATLTNTTLQIITEDDGTNSTSTAVQLPQSPQSPQSLIPPQLSACGRALPSSQNGTPITSGASTAPSSPRLAPIRQNSGSTTPRVRPPATTLNIPGMTKSRVSPDGKIAQRDVGSKLVIIMVGLPARGKSYITKKIQRYLSWQQHETKIFNVGKRRRDVKTSAVGPIPGSSPRTSPRKHTRKTSSISGVIDAAKLAELTQAARILINGTEAVLEEENDDEIMENDGMDQTAEFFDPANKQAAQVREKLAMGTLRELLDFLLLKNGSVGILDATNSTLERRKVLYNAIKEREPKLGVLFIESVCEDEKLLEANMRLKLNGPDYKGKDPEASYEDFKKRVIAYESAYITIGKYEEDNSMQYIKMIDVGRKMINYNLTGFLATGVAGYLSTFNLSPRQIWITRHGKSIDNCAGKIGGDSELTEEGKAYGITLYNFITEKRTQWEQEQKHRVLESTPLPQRPGDHTPPYPDLAELESKNFCVWTSMLKRSVQTADDFEKDENFDVKNWEMLNELNAGSFEGLTYTEIAERFPTEFAKRKEDKLHYIYPGVGGEGYLQVISRLRDMVREIERIKDHVLIIGHQCVSRVLMAYFRDLPREKVADLPIPLGMLFCIEPKPYGVEFHAYQYDDITYKFNEIYDYDSAQLDSKDTPT